MEITLHPGITLASLGWDGYFETRFTTFAAAGYAPGRVAAQHKGAYVVLSEAGRLDATVTGKLRYAASGAAELPVVGDWVALAVRAEEGAATIQGVVERRTRFSRKVAGFESDEQVLAANIDVVFLTTSLNADLNPRRIERYLTMAYESGATPVVVLTKADLCDDVPAALDAVQEVAIGTSVHVVSAVTGEGFDELGTYMAGHKTVALLGSSGVGKSTLVNELAGEEILKVQEIRDDDARGRHTTTHREMVLLPSGGIVVDTPGMRELQLWEASDGLSGSFQDIAELAAGCRFRDCTHGREPGCAVRAAVEAGTLPVERLASYNKLQRELMYLERKRDQRLASQETRRWKVQHKAMRRAKSPKV
ncbi:MAG TPA: ribosome small subunit-dependent GTPase A [Actinomycetota bacterium]|nr:ribosome small subunit-dependent GTPase A [Actinomycetota bacterium]